MLHSSGIKQILGRQAPATTLHNAATAIAQGAELGVEGYNAVVLEVSGTAATLTVTPKVRFEAAGAIAYTAVRAYSLVGAEQASGIQSKSIFVVPTFGAARFVAELTAVSGGGVTVKARPIYAPPGLLQVGALPALPAGTNVIGKTGIDQTTPGTTNLVRAGSGATDDGAAAGEVYPGAGVYQATADEVDDGDVGRLRISKRRAAVVAPDYRTLTLTNATPVPAGSDITNLVGGAVVGSDLQIRSTTTVYLLVPMAGWRDVLIEYFASPAYDQTLVLQVYAHIGNTLGVTLLTISVPTTAARVAIASAGASGQGGFAGGAAAANGSYYTVPALAAPWSHIAIYLRADVAPTAGAHTFHIRRRA